MVLTGDRKTNPIPDWLVCDVDVDGQPWWTVRLFLEDGSGPSYFGPFKDASTAQRFYGDALAMKQAADVMGGGDVIVDTMNMVSQYQGLAATGG